ncbi:MAG: type II 3-dehydroquinate dehydratase [Flavobacteriales bacterium]|nr:type II 3-dehydroquinate dehydratase [Flavobacteriales bacterium]
MINMSILIINGPNLNLLGRREPVFYGSDSFDEVLAALKSEFGQADLKYRQSNSESELIEWIHGASNEGVKGVVLNPAAFTHTSIALADAVSAIEIPVVEVHISNVYQRKCALSTAAKCEGPRLKKK